jgi:hypothetical protein
MLCTSCDDDDGYSVDCYTIAGGFVCCAHCTAFRYPPAKA